MWQLLSSMQFYISVMSRRIMEESLKKGFTTGSCSAAAAKAGAYMLLSGRTKDSIEIETWILPGVKIL